MRRPLLSKRREVELLELFELTWRAAVLLSIVCAVLTPWVLLWRWL